MLSCLNYWDNLQTDLPALSCPSKLNFHLRNQDDLLKTHGRLKSVEIVGRNGNVRRLAVSDPVVSA